MTTNTEIIEAAATRIGSAYIFPERAAEAVAAIRRRAAAGGYDGLADAEFCTAVTADLQETCADKHLRLLWRDEPQEVGGEEDEGGDDRQFAALEQAENQGIRRVERLEGNIGYLDVRLVARAGSAGRAIGAAMELVAHTKALILDLRGNRGGSPDGAALWCSYFFADGEVHLNDIYDGATGETRQIWSSAHLPAPRYADRPLYVLTGGATFSGAEDIAYSLQAQGRATLVGETTRGGAHPTSYFPLTPHVTVTVPVARSVNPVTGTNWEGVGVRPDIAVPADDALRTAHQDALRLTSAG